nr:ergothioneine biosynthesis glutamate--cysteine ligase EgtA [Longimycelium tulufanense]
MRAADAAGAGSRRLRTRAEAEGYVASVCFKHGPPRLVGVELEWTVHHIDDPRRPLDAAVLAKALGPHTPTTLVPDSPHRPLSSGSLVTLEPGGQVEVSSRPHPTLTGLIDAVTADTAELAGLLRAAGLFLGERGIDPHRPPNRLLMTPRYDAMQTAFDRIGPDGMIMMCSTAGLQVCLDAGETARVPARWAAIHVLGPVLTAAFANSPVRAGVRTGWASARMAALFGTDPPRTRPAVLSPQDPGTSWARRVVNTPLVCVRRPDGPWHAPPGITFADWIAGALVTPPTVDDLDYHLTTLFTPVRPRGYLEVRYLDTQPLTEWVVPLVTLVTLFAEESTVDEVLRVAAPAGSRWVQAARHGMADPVLARTARDLYAVTAAALPAMKLPTDLAEHVLDRLQEKFRPTRGAGSDPWKG